MVLTCCGASIDEIVTDYARYRLCWKVLPPLLYLTPITCFERHSLHHCRALLCECMGWGSRCAGRMMWGLWRWGAWRRRS